MSNDYTGGLAPLFVSTEVWKGGLVPSEGQHNGSFFLFLGDPESVAGEYGRHSLYKMLGYFSLVGLLRLHSLLGDYYQAIKVLENIELNKKVTRQQTLRCSFPNASVQTGS